MAEADESDGSFLRLAPVIAVVTNIDPEHLDHYGTFEALQDAFAAFANRVPFWGVAVLCLDHPGVQAIVPRMTRRTRPTASPRRRICARRDVRAERGGMRFSVRQRGALARDGAAAPAGRHNVRNALATLCGRARARACPSRPPPSALESFLGIERRFEIKGDAAGVRVVDDYGHHPAEVRATLAAARGLHAGRIVVAFQPHRYTRTRDLWDEFARAFNDADVLVLTEIYAAGEDKIPGVEAAPLVEAVRAHGHRDVRFARDLDRVLETLLALVAPGDLVVTLGAGSISSLGARLLARLAERTRDRARRTRGARGGARRPAFASTCRSRASPRCGSAGRPTRWPTPADRAELARLLRALRAPSPAAPGARRRLQHARARRPRSRAS